MTDIQVNTTTSNSQTYQANDMADDGTFVVVWQSLSQDTSSYGIYGQRFNADGSKAGAEFLVNTYTFNSQHMPDVAMRPTGEFIVTWQSSGQDGSSDGIYAQRYNADGTANGGEFQVNTYTSGAQREAHVAVDDDGDFAVTWRSAGQDGSAYGIFAQRYDSSGVAQGSEFQVNTTTTNSQRGPDIAMDPDGNFVVTWHSNGQDGSGYGIYAQRYAADGSALGSEFQVNTYTAGAQTSAAVSIADDGRFVIVWQSNGQDGSGYGVYAQRYHADGTTAGSEFRVNTYTASAQRDPKVAMFDDGRFVVGWHSNGQDGSSYGVYAQTFNADGTANGSETLVNSFTSGVQYKPDLNVSDTGAYVVSWFSRNQDGDNYGVFAQGYNLTCFLRGTWIATERGEVRVEELRAGDRVRTRFAGLRPIRWVGVQRFDARLAGPEHQPIRFAPGSLGAGAPHSALFTSPGHAMLVQGVLAHAGALVNDVSITHARVGGTIEYFHLDLGPHDCVLANGAWAESYFEDHNRDSFHNSGEFHAAFPDHVPHRQETCLPIVTTTDPRLPALHAALAPRLDAAMLTDDPDLHLLVDGRRLALERLDKGTWAATLPTGVRSLRLRSRSVRPNMVFGMTDCRALGLLVLGIDVEGRPGLAADHPALCQGWHAVEQCGQDRFRWTDGDARIPVQLLGDIDAPLRVSVRGWHAKLLLAPNAHQQRAAA
jgi:hypothetical protein